MKNNNRLFIFDAYALIYRAFYAFIKNPMRNSKGLNTSAIYGFVNSLFEIISNEKPTHIAVAFDTPAPTFRHEIYPEYKATRQETPEDIIKAVPYIRQIIEALNISIVEIDGFEADDIIGTLAKAAANANFITYIVSPDKDLGQLIDEKIFLYKPRKNNNENEIIGVNELCKQFEIKHPKQVIDILSLWGDASDNIPGAPGIGEKTAKKLIADFESVENLLNNYNQLTGKIKETLQKFKEQILLSKKLATIDTNVPLKISFDEFILNEPDYNQLKNIFEELEFKSLLNQIFKPKEKTAQPVQQSLFPEYTYEINLSGASLLTLDKIPHTYHVIDNEEKRKQLINKILTINEFCFDTETTSLNVYEAQIVGLSICFKKNEAYYIPFPISQTETLKIINDFKPIFENHNISKIGQNVKFDLAILQNYNIEVNGYIFDTMLAHYLLQPESRHNLDYLAEKYLNYTPVSIESLIGKKGKNQLSMRNIEIDKIKEYACEDADVTWQLKPILLKQLEENKLTRLFYELEMPLVKVLIAIEKSGFSIDIDYLNKYAKVLINEINNIEKEIYKIAGYEFNISSPKQLGELLFDRLKIDTEAKKTKTLQYSTSEETLVKLFDKHPIINHILEYRSIKKLLTTYVESLPELVNPKTGKIHTSFNQAITATGRLSSTNPNLQNIPIREERGREIRKAFIASSSNNILLAADYSQIELRLMAHFSKDKGLIDAFYNNEDIHAATAAKINHINLNEVTSDMRRKAKTTNFGIIYGISAFGLAQRLNISRTEAKKFIDEYFQSYPGVKDYMEKTISFCRKNGFVETIMGRKRFLPDINSRNQTVRGFAERNAINTPIQGSAADIIKLAMIKIHNKFKEANLKSNMILQVHDELIFDVLKDELDIVKNIVKNEMENVCKLEVPLIVDIGTGNNWLEAH
jgi:DNA polymerase-1